MSGNAYAGAPFLQAVGVLMGQDAQASPRLAMACWDYSWLTRREGRHSEYRNLDRVFEELAARGYNCLRLDPCPHLVAAGPNGMVAERFEVLPEGRDLRRGVRGPVQTYPRRVLADLLRKARQYDIRLWLASWYVPDTQARRSFVRSPGDFIRVWAETLAFIRDEGFAGQIEAVDFCHEFPMAPWAHGAWRRIFGTHPANPLPLLRSWDSRVEERVQGYLLEVPRALRALFPDIWIGVSTCHSLEASLRRLDTSELDFLDTHMWLTDDPAFRIATGSLLPVAVPSPLENLRGRVAALLYRSRQEHWLGTLRDRLEAQSSFARVRRLTPVLGEGYIRAVREQALDWGWVRSVSEQVIEEALKRDVRVINPAIYGRPHSPGFWEDQAWQSRINDLIRSG